MSEPYRPSNGTEGDCFYAQWCRHCIHDDPATQKLCDILGRTYFLTETDPDYPREWIYGEDGNPCCTAFNAENSQ